jgi:PAS domain S-box-containing protein
MKDHPIMQSIDKIRRSILGDTDPGSNRELERQRTIAIGVCLIGTLALVAFGIAALVTQSLDLATADLVVAALLLGLTWRLRGRSSNWSRTISYGVAVSGALFVYLFATGGASGTGYVWFYAFPLFACALLGAARGIRATAFLLGSTVVLLAMQGFLPRVHEYSGAFMSRFFGSLIVVSLFSYLTELTREHAQSRLVETNDSLGNAVSKLLRTQARLKESESEHRHLVERASDGIALVEEGRLSFTNPRMAEIIGVRVEDTLREPFVKYVHPSERQRVQTLYQKRMRDEDIPSTYETSLLHQDGREICVEINAQKTTQNGRICDLVMIRDITERKRVEDAILAARESAEAANRAKSQFLANMSHEIRTPMHGVLGMADLLMSTELDAKQKRFIDTIQSSANNLLQLINEILDFSKIESGRADLASIEFSLRPLVEETVELLSEEAYRKGLEIAYCIEPDVPQNVKGDPHRLRQVLLNLVGNAVKFTEEGEVVVKVRRARDAADESFVEFEIRDTGIGISPSQRHEIFEDFAQGDASSAREHGGSGLGLAISRRLVELMGGALELAEAPKQGSVFRFSTCFKKVDNGENPPIDDQLFDSVRILVADPSPTWQEILEQHLRHRGASVEYADTGRDALRAIDLANSAGQPFHLVLVEQRLPHGSAVELARLLQEEHDLSAPRIIALAPWFQTSDLDPTTGSPLAGRIAKPIAELELEDVVLRALGRQPVSDRQARQESSEAAGTARFSGRVLLAEDNLVNQQVAIEMLRSMGFEVALAEDGMQATEAAAREEFDLVLMDCQMPRMDGFESAQAIRLQEAEYQDELRPEESRRVPIIALTANASKEARGQCLRAGMDDYLSKPFDQAQLTTVLARWIPAKHLNHPSTESPGTTWIRPSGLAARQAF